MKKAFEKIIHKKIVQMMMYKTFIPRKLDLGRFDMRVREDAEFLIRKLKEISKKDIVGCIKIEISG